MRKASERHTTRAPGAPRDWRAASRLWTGPVPGALVLLLAPFARAQETDGTRLLRQPTVSATHVAFEYGGDIWIVGRPGGEARRLTATPAIETDPHFSPDGRRVAFTSNRTGMPQVWVVGADGGEPRRLTWYPSPSFARGWTPDGTEVLYASDRGSAPVPYAHLWLVPPTAARRTRSPRPWRSGDRSPPTVDAWS